MNARARRREQSLYDLSYLQSFDVEVAPVLVHLAHELELGFAQLELVVVVVVVVDRLFRCRVRALQKACGDGRCFQGRR